MDKLVKKEVLSVIKSQLKMYICGGIKMYNYSAKATQSLSL